MIRDLIAKGESKTLEYKAMMPQNSQIAQTVCAFANRAGGYLIIGISDEGEILGLSREYLDELIEKIPNMIHDTIFPMILPEIYTYTLEGKTVLVVQVYPGNHVPYFIKRKGKMAGSYVRVGRTNKLADAEMIKDLERQQINLSFDEDIFKEIQYHEIETLVDAFQKSMGRAVSVETLLSLKLFLQIGSQMYLTNAGAIILGKLSNTTVKCGRFLGESVIDFIDRKEYSGNIFEVMENAIVFLKNHLNLSGIIAGQGLVRQDVLEIPESVLREGIINAMMHRNYAIEGADIKVAVFDSRIEITSPGGLPKSLTVADIYMGRSEIRNKSLSRVFMKLGYAEHWGSGIPRMRELCLKMGLKEPEIEENGLYVTLRIYRKNHVVLDSVTAYDETKKSKRDRIEAEQNLILELLKENKHLTVKDLSRLLTITEASVQRRLKSMQDNNIIKRQGSKKTGWWHVRDRG